MDEMLERHLELYRSLKRNKVEYLIIGGVACGIYGSPRATKDLDITIRLTLNNAKKLLIALREVGFGTAQLTTPEKIIANELSIFEDYIRLDVLTKVKGLDFDTAWKNRETKFLKGIELEVASIEDLINSKKAAARLIDKEDIKILKKIKRLK